MSLARSSWWAIIRSNHLRKCAARAFPVSRRQQWMGQRDALAAQAVGESLGGPVGERLAWGAAQVRLGGAPADAWRRVGEIPGADALARLLDRTAESGSPAAGPVARFAADCRAEQGRTATARARRAAVQMTAPVALCFLPAFLAIGVVPVVIGLAGGLMSGQ